MAVNEPLPVSEVLSPPIVETPNPNDAAARNPGDPTESWNADGTQANSVQQFAATIPTNPTPDATQSDPAHVPSPYQDPAALEAQAESARLREEALQAENRFRVDKTPRVDVDATPHIDEAPTYEAPAWSEPRDEHGNLIEERRE